MTEERRKDFGEELIQTSEEALTFAIVEKCRARAHSMDFVPLTDEQLAEARERDEMAVADLACEDMHGTAVEEAMFAMFLEERLPHEIRDQLVDEWIAEDLQFPPHHAAG